jgi:hypothetical protein
MQFEYQLVSEWPSLAWLAMWQQTSETVIVQHGQRVETNANWFCEAVWAGSYAAGDFDLTDIVAGSGGRIRNGSIVYVSSGSTVDRLVSMQVGDSFFVSNSLPCLLVAAGADVDVSYPKYYEDLLTIIQGINSYRPFLSTTAGPVRLTYFDNLTWNSNTLEVSPKPVEYRDFSCFERYRSFLSTSLALLAENMVASPRLYPYRMLGTLSSGYDSCTVSALAREAGCSEALCISRARGGGEEEGEAIAGFLGVRPLLIERAAWLSEVNPEPPFIVGDAMGTDIPFKSAEPHLPGRVLLTGYHGDVIWAKEGKSTNEYIVRGDQSGLSLTEYRLHAGFIHCPIAFWGVRQLRDLRALSISTEMKSWDISGNYSRTICRRIVEEAGVPRELFGQRKAATAVLFNEILTQASLLDYLAWIKRQRWNWLKQGRLPPLTSDEFERKVLQLMKEPPMRKLRSLLSRTPVLWRMIIDDYPDLDTPTPLRRYLFPWALESEKAKYKNGWDKSLVHG